MICKSLAWFAFLAMTLHASSSAVVLNEVMANPAGSEYTDEFIEILQGDSAAVDLTGWAITDGEAEDVLLPMVGGTMTLEAGGLALILDSGYTGAYAGRVPPGTLLLTVADGALCDGGLSNSTPEALGLLDALGQVVDAVWTRPDLLEDISLERRDPGTVCVPCWLPGRGEGGSPGSPNTVLRRRWAGEMSLQDRSLLLRASGWEGCRGRLLAHAGQAPCLHHLDLGSVDLAVGEEQELDLPQLALDGWNPLIIELEDEAGEIVTLLDTLAWAPRRGSVVIEAVQVTGRDWIQLLWPYPCPLLLDGLEVESRAFSLSLEGWLPENGRLLLGPDPPACPETVHIPRNLSLAMAGGAWVMDEAGQVLDEAQWPEHPEEARPWRRLDPGEPGDSPDNWRAEALLVAGCPPPALGGVEPVPGKAWALSRREISCSRGGEAPLVARHSEEGAWILHLYHLDGSLLLSKRGHGRELVWNGLGEAGAALPPGLYLLHLAGSQGEALFPLSLVP